MEQTRKGTLRLLLVDKLPAYALASIIELVNETYTSLRWLELAEQHRGSAPYGDSTFDYEDFLMVPKVEIGTPNYLELNGLLETLSQTLVYLGGVGGIVAIANKAIGSGLSHYNAWLDMRQKRIELELASDPNVAAAKKRKLLAEAERAELELEKTRREISQNPPEPIVERSRRLLRSGKVSPRAMGFKQKTQERLEEYQHTAIANDMVIGWQLIPYNADIS